MKLNQIGVLQDKDLLEFGQVTQIPAGDYNLRGFIVNNTTGKAYNIVLKMDTPKLVPETNFSVFCSCDDFKFRWAWVLNEHDSLLAPQTFILTPPKKTNSAHKLDVCKHIKVFLKKIV